MTEQATIFQDVPAAECRPSNSTTPNAKAKGAFSCPHGNWAYYKLWGVKWRSCRQCHALQSWFYNRRAKLHVWRTAKPSTNRRFHSAVKRQIAKPLSGKPPADAPVVFGWKGVVGNHYKIPTFNTEARYH